MDDSNHREENYRNGGSWSCVLLGGVGPRVGWSTVVMSLVGRRWIWSAVAQPPEYPETEPTGLLGFLFGLGFGFVAASHVIVPARPTSVVLGCAAPRSGHLSSMASGGLGMSGTGGGRRLGASASTRARSPFAGLSALIRAHEAN